MMRPMRSSLKRKLVGGGSHKIKWVEEGDVNLVLFHRVPLSEKAEKVLLRS